MVFGDCQHRQVAEVVCASPTYITCSASTSSGSLCPQGDGSDEELLCGAILCRVTPDSHMRVSFIKSIFINIFMGQLPLTASFLAAHFGSAVTLKGTPFQWSGSPLPIGRSPLCQVHGYSVGLVAG
ncbi:hypothetical protein FKM82_020253 [Ascaphus truei]